jgi:hypothetical protein
MKNLRNILVAVLLVTFVAVLTGCNSGGGRVALYDNGETCIGCAEIDPFGANINDKNTTELLTVIREEELQDTVVKLTKGKKPVIKTPGDITTATGTASLMGNAFGPRPKVVRAR